MYQIYRNTWDHLWPDGPMMAQRNEDAAVDNWVRYCTVICERSRFESEETPKT